MFCSLSMPTLHTVLRPIDARDFGFALVHQHLLCAFAGATKTGPPRRTPPGLAAVDVKVVEAAAMAQRATGLAVVSHTAQGAAALEQVRLLAAAGGDPGRLIVAHSDAEPDPEARLRIAASGAWFSCDGI